MSPRDQEQADRDAEQQERGRVLTLLGHLEKEMGEVKAMLQTKFVTRDEFAPIKGLVYGFVGLVLIAVIGALIAMVVRK